MICSHYYCTIQSQLSITLSSYHWCIPQIGRGRAGIDGVHLELRILGELKSHRLGRVAKFSPLPVSQAVGASSDKISSLHHATHSPFGQTHSGLSDQQHKHGQALRRCGSQLLSQGLCTGAPASPFPFPGKDRNRVMFPKSRVYKEGGLER